MATLSIRTNTPESTERKSPSRATFNSKNLRYALNDTGIVFPQGSFNTLYDPDLSDEEILSSFQAYWLITEDKWNRLEWNPPRTKEARERDGDGNRVAVFDEFDPDASPKLTWEKLLVIYKRWTFQEEVKSYGSRNWINNHTLYSRDALVQAVIAHPSASGGIVPSEILSHVPALMYSAARSANAGVFHPHAILRNSEGNATTLWTEAEHHRFLQDLASRTNLIESARNQIYGDLNVDRVLFLNESAAETDRQDALDRIIAALQIDVLDANMLAKAAEMAIMNIDTLPANLDKMREVLLERVEDTATGKRKELIHAVSQQGMDLPASCVDQNTADREIAQEKQLGQIEILRAETITGVKVAYGTAVLAINAVTFLKTPTFIKAAPIAGVATVTIDVKQVAGIVGNVAALASLVSGKGSWTLTNEGTGVRIVFTRAGTEAAVFDIAARNLCGPSSYHVTLTP